MTRHLTKALMLIAVLGVAACNNPDRYANGAGGTGANAANGISSSPLGDPNDPKSIAYFNQTVGDTVHFAEDQSTLDPQAQQILAAQATWLARNSDYGVIVEGHADERGTREYNLALGARRASAVKEFLAAHGIPATRMRTISYGKERPIALCSAPQCYAANRRAVTVLTQPGNS
ncbi:OmpA/MotB family protein [Defluviimonas sp. 20V17]|uniref:Peptidoglycan-associated lipoprotein n=1 Tax=Allgaiera indica TaxID=765699 RepID=A0AAN4UTQ7_9RHOB|nr:peptidoglycan-associated lipoprotein Pal [Allgaiera indica]KDB05465.1 OmpA/MotB family protein [Defluviimonas sp. 20V17]GHE04670.1 peptidoglycan-associated lipoprotein [Allgaiera indica]SDX47508.1 peptidoglycan-associated lipoprotein [Allgaiera indica]